MTDQLLDSGGITEHKADIEIDNGSSFTGNLRVASGVFGVVGLAAIISGGAGFIIGPPIVAGCTYLLTSRHGTDLSISTNYARQYSKKLGMFKSGKWIPMSAFSDICILKLGKSRAPTDITGAVSTKFDASKNEVYLMTHDHRKRFLLKVCNSMEEAVKFAEDMAEQLDKNFTKFNPQVSKKTQERLRYRK